MRIVRKIVLFHFFLVASCFFTLPAVANSATIVDTFTQIQKSIDTKDFTLFTQYIDIHSVCSDVVNIVFADASSQLEVNVNTSDGIEQEFLSSFTNNAMAKSFLTSEAKRFLASAVSDGYLAGIPTPQTADNTGLFGKQLDFLGKGRSEIIAQKVIQQQDTSAVMTGVYKNYFGSYPLKVEMQKENNVWRIKKIQNIPQLMDIIKGK